MKHNIRWFKNRIGTKIYCNDHNKGTKCNGMTIDSEYMIKHFMECQNKRGIEFKD